MTVSSQSSHGIARRPLGSTGEQVSIICLGGWHIRSVTDDGEAIKIMHAAIDEGINFFDNAWDYHEGASEELMGKALAGGRREKVFLMSKNCARDAKGTRQHLEDSLRRLQTDVLDLWQFHEINYDNDPDWVIEQGGLAEALKAQKEGKIRFLGFTGHKSPEIHLKMLGIHPWQTVQLPINVCDYYYRSFTHEVLPKLTEKKIGAIGMKSLGGGNKETGGRLMAQKVCSPEEAMRFALSQPIDSLVVGIDSWEVFRQDIAMAQNYTPLVGAELENLLARVKPVSSDGRHEHFKSQTTFDGPYHRKQHGFE